MIAVFRCASRETFLAKMSDLGITMTDDERGLRPADQGDFCPTPWVQTVDAFVATVRLTDEQWAKVPEYTQPLVFVVDWDSETEDLEWPMYLLSDGSNVGAPCFA